MRAQILTATLLLAACGGPEEIGMTEEELMIGGVVLDPCSGQDDVSNDWKCATHFFSPDAPYTLTGGDSDWFWFKSVSTTKRYTIWAGDGTAATKCKFYKRSSSGPAYWFYRSPCTIQENLIASSYYYLEVEPMYWSSTGSYQLGMAISHETDDSLEPFEPCDTCGVVAP